MIVYNVKELIKAKGLKEQRKITLEEVGNAVGLKKAAISRMITEENYSTTTRTLDALCTYFDCKIEDLITFKKSMD